MGNSCAKQSPRIPARLLVSIDSISNKGEFHRVRGIAWGCPREIPSALIGAIGLMSPSLFQILNLIDVLKHHCSTTFDDQPKTTLMLFSRRGNVTLNFDREVVHRVGFENGW